MYILLLGILISSTLVALEAEFIPLSSLALLPGRKVESDASVAGTGSAFSDTDGIIMADEANKEVDRKKSGIFSLRPIVKKCLSFVISDKDVLSIMSTALSGTMWIFIFMSVIGTLGLDTKPLISLVTVSGFTLGLAAKDLLTSTIAAGYMISMRAFKRDMIISIGEHKGKVRSFDTNFVKLLTTDNRLVLIPMASVYGKPIVIHQSK
jgi:small-conductance mechanosensitive channel